MGKQRPLTEEERADLVAYLDGELAGEAARAMEAKLSLDPRMRAEADSLKRAWEMLDYLPRPEPKQDFTARTLSRLEPVRPVPPSPPRSWAWAKVLGWAACVAGAAAGGYFGYRAWVPHEPGERELLRDLRLIENKKLYDRIDDAGFLEKLADPDLFGE